ncbi:hypothetical protein SAMN02745132_04150 [Enterovibrio nigricans DSM 22720]|uniref:Uncharacterized protein n=1 Tax=Enterovibrio nigricans DSM 22720 TaxID=1121868 RepID=A0A1T4VPQ7_9GAMM|nr:hypothetical protein SAMN02745132_04150 [Enterovibrio nigricans DSM 22720]
MSVLLICAKANKHMTLDIGTSSVRHHVESSFITLNFKFQAILASLMFERSHFNLMHMKKRRFACRPLFLCYQASTK